MMKFLVFVGVVGAAAYFFPQIYEQTGTPCQALEAKALRKNLDRQAAGSIIAGLTLTLSDGNLGRKMAEDQYPKLPAAAGCVATYYHFPKDWVR